MPGRHSCFSHDSYPFLLPFGGVLTSRLFLFCALALENPLDPAPHPSPGFFDGLSAAVSPNDGLSCGLGFAPFAPTFGVSFFVPGVPFCFFPLVFFFPDLVPVIAPKRIIFRLSPLNDTIFFHFCGPPHLPPFSIPLALLFFQTNCVWATRFYPVFLPSPLYRAPPLCFLKASPWKFLVPPPPPTSMILSPLFTPRSFSPPHLLGTPRWAGALTGSPSA